MCYKDEDERLWQEDPYEYIRMKFSQCAFLDITFHKDGVNAHIFTFSSIQNVFEITLI